MRTWNVEYEDVMLTLSDEQYAELKRLTYDDPQAAKELAETLAGVVSQHDHVQAPESPADGDEITCACGYRAVFVVLDDGKPGEWVES